MGMITKETIRELIREQNFGSTTEIMEAIKDMFWDMLQEGLDNELGYDKQVGRSDPESEEMSKNYRKAIRKRQS